MIYLKENDYKIVFYVDESGTSQVKDYIDRLSVKDRAKIAKYMDFLREKAGVLDEPYSKHIRGKLRELRVDFGKNKHRIFYFTFINRKIVMLHAFLKKTEKTPESEIKKAEHNYHGVIRNKRDYE